MIEHEPIPLPSASRRTPWGLAAGSWGLAAGSWSLAAGLCLLGGLSLALWAIHGPEVFAEMITGMIALCF
jgi:hypothetical protein